MEPVPAVPQSIASFVHQAQKMMSHDTVSRENFHKLSSSQISLAIQVINNTDNVWDRTSPKMEKELTKIIEILHGATEGKTGFSLPTFLSKDNKTKQIGILVDTIARSKAEINPSLALNQISTFKEVTTNHLFKQMRGEELTKDSQIAAQLHRDLKGGLALPGIVKINNVDVEMIKPPVKVPADWRELLPEDIKNFLGSDFEKLGSTVAIAFNQGIAGEAFDKGRQILENPSMPNLFRRGDGYPQFKFSRVNGEIILEVNAKGCLIDTNNTNPIKNCEMTTVINLTNPESLVSITIAPKDI